MTSMAESAILLTRKQKNTRRELLKTIGAGAFVASLGACAPMPAGLSRYPRPYSRRPWVAPRISMDAVIREVVGHRPYRPSGFVVKGEQFDDKLVVHNYGHGGGGISLSWGSSALAVRETRGMPPGDVAVIGSGVMGLTSARLLQDAGWNVTIYAREVARHTTSNVAAGEWSPFSVYNPAYATPAFMAQLEWASRISHHAYTNLGGRDYGVSWMEAYTLSDSPIEETLGELADLFPYTASLQPGEHPFPSPYVHRQVTMKIEPAILLRRLTQDFLLAGGQVVVTDFADKSEVLSLPESVIFNCSGMGAAKLFDDVELTPAKGQLVYLTPDPDVDFWTVGGGEGLLYMLSRSDVLLLGGTFKLGDYTTHAEPQETERIVSEHRRIFSEFG
ncbi:MAG: FAD-binding oxidoreductase [Gammaproteobacteria bacterium]|nr:FAD-binding oxidoreductase [Gammaproteobacteria bacterium]